ncbi:dehydrogenase [Halobacteriales archaeon QH_6_64_20]|jgi:NAD(P)-dependent dehydrogenase (short-subunit alcohol dehydrogenase family)|nr:MAG: dehydrogenase [Halobacteriales archaeon QH_6_64_20]
MRFDGETVFITGGGSGIGRETAMRCAEEGADVVVADVDREAVEETTDAIGEAGGKASSYELDVRDAEALAEAIDTTAEEGGIDVLVNNAGISHPRSDMEDVDIEVRDRVIDINTKGVWNGCRAAIPHLKDQGSGAIVNTASLAGLIGMPGGAAYSLSKGAVVNFTRAIAAELGSHGVRANAVCPGVVETPLVTDDRDPEEWPDLRDRMAEAYPLGRLGRPEDVANAVRFLASEEAAWITGHALVVDGGYSCA